MDLVELIPNLIAMIASLIAIFFLARFAMQMRGGSLATVVNLLVWGIFLSVTLHAAFELGSLYGLISGETLFVVMGTLLSIGSILFIVAGYLGLKANR